MSNTRLALAFEDPALVDTAKRLADQLQLKAFLLNESPQAHTDFDYLLMLTHQGLVIAKTNSRSPTFVQVDFVTGSLAHRRRYGGGKNQQLAKAVGLHKRKDLQVLDATAGLGSDAFVLASLGCQVSLLERVPFIRQLLQDGLARGEADDEVRSIVQRMKLLPNLLTNQASQAFDVVYLDPMFPHSDSSAAVKKEMAFFRDLVGNDEDADSLLPAALQVAKYRVVVKRPKSAPYLNNTPPNYQLTGKAVRFDIYTLLSLTS